MNNPSLYALINIGACWDPYENTNHVQFAIANEDNGTTYFDILFWDKEVNNVALMYNGYGPYYYGSEYLLERDNPEFDDFNYFKGEFKS